MQFVAATWNLWGDATPGTYRRDRNQSRGAVPGSPADCELDPDITWAHRRVLLIAELTAVQPDVVFLQEACAREPTAAQQLADALHMHCAVSPSDADLGLAVLARSPIKYVGTLDIDHWPDTYPRPLHVRLAIGEQEMDCVNLHLPLSTHGDRKPLVAPITDHFAATGSLVVGDLNAPPDSDVLSVLEAHGLKQLTVQASPTMPSQDPAVQLDYILGTDNFTGADHRILGASPDEQGFYASDHRGLAVTITTRDHGR